MKKGFRLKILSFPIFLGIVACSQNSGDPAIFNPGSVSYEEDETYSDLVHIQGTGAVVRLGTRNSSAKPNERPVMHVRFDYDFSIGKHEVSCEEFNQLMTEFYDGKAFEAECSNKDIPVSNVSYYDAVLAANARSKKERLDTVYTYNNATFDNEGHCTNLDGLTFSPDKESFRLPTEAEWVFAANLDWSTENSWNAENSDYRPHEVCTQKPSNLGLCDMAGNLMEWVNDWLGSYKDTTIYNYVGAPDGGSLGERILKGGSYRSESRAINPFSRGDVYTVTSSTRADYVGFRLAFGSIPNPTWLNNSGNVSDNSVIPVASSATLKKLAGTFRSKLAFRNDLTENIAFVNYSAGTLSITEIRDTLPAFHPEISPDGQRVAFCTVPEGISGNSSIYVRDLTAKGENLVRLDVESASIPRWRVSNGDTTIVYVSTAANNKNDGEFNSYSTWEVPFRNGKFGSPKKILDGNYHGGISEDNKLAVTGARLLRARIATEKDIFQQTAKDSIWYNSEQACNASLAKDGSKRTLFLDFGGKTGREFVGENYGVHERLLIVDSTGSLVQSVAAPEGYSFDHSEWATENLVVATLTNNNGAHEKIVLVNLTDSSVTDLVKGEEIWHPSLWVASEEKIVTNLDLDSAGQYFVIGGSEAALCLRNKMEILWNHRDSKLAILGSSRPLNGIRPVLMDDSLEAINLANVPNSIYVSDYLLSNYLLKHLDKLKYVVVSLDIDMWWKVEANSYDNFFHSEYRQYPGFVYDENHQFWENGYPEGIAEASHNAFNYEYFIDIYMESRGFNGEPSGSWETEPTVDYDSTWFDKNSETYYANFRRLESMITAAENQGVTLIGVIFPMSPGYRNTGSFGRYGIRRSKVESLIQEIADLSKRHPNFILMDENRMGNHDYTDEMANNRDHLSIKGAERFTQRLDSLIKALK